MREQSGYEQTVLGDAEVTIHEENQQMGDNLEVIDQHRLDEATRAAGLKIAEKYLAGQEYDLARLTAEINAQVGFITAAYVEIGRKLLIIKTVEGHGKFTKWLEANFPLSPRQARNFMKVALKLEQAPELRPLAKGGLTKALLLLDLPEDDLEEFKEEGTLYGKPVEDWQLKTAKELAAELDKEKKNRDKIIAEETKGLKAERDALQKKCKEMERFVPVEDPDPEWSLSQVTELTKAVLAVVSLAEQFMYDDRLQADKITQGKIEQQLDIARKVINKFNHDWNVQFNPQD